MKIAMPPHQWHSLEKLEHIVYPSRFTRFKCSGQSPCSVMITMSGSNLFVSRQRLLIFVLKQRCIIVMVNCILHLSTLLTSAV